MFDISRHGYIQLILALFIAAHGSLINWLARPASSEFSVTVQYREEIKMGIRSAVITDLSEKRYISHHHNTYMYLAPDSRYEANLWLYLARVSLGGTSPVHLALICFAAGLFYPWAIHDRWYACTWWGWPAIDGTNEIRRDCIRLRSQAKLIHVHEALMCIYMLEVGRPTYGTDANTAAAAVYLWGHARVEIWMFSFGCWNKTDEFGS
jgi:hypothetical protein